MIRKSFANLMGGLSPSFDLVQRYRQQHNQVLLVMVIGAGLRCYCHYWPSVTITITTSFIIFAVVIDLYGPLVLLALLPDLTMAKWREGERGGADQGFVRREMRNFFGFDRNYFRLQYCRAFFREGVWFSPKKTGYISNSDCLRLAVSLLSEIFCQHGNWKHESWEFIVELCLHFLLNDLTPQ